MALCAGAAVSVKYSGVLAAPIVVIALLLRALMPAGWRVVGVELPTRGKRLAAALAACLVVAVVAYAFVWMCYGFRFAPMPDPNLRINTDRMVDAAKSNEVISQTFGPRERISAQQLANEPEPSITEQEVARHTPARIVRMTEWMQEHELLPQAWLAGFSYTYQSTLIRSSFLLGDYRVTGWWYFFPLAMLFKTPLATLSAAMLALCAAVLWRIERKGRDQPNARASLTGIDLWGFACLLIPPALYGLTALTASLNLGLRHVLPVYPFIFVATGVVLAAIFDRWGRVGQGIVALLVIGLIAETLRTYPDYIAYFNEPSGGWRGGINLLGDSNLDWGQDLKLLAEWQKLHPDQRLFLSYFGVADPHAYGIEAVHLPGGWPFAAPQVPRPGEHGVAAISATNLQGIYFNPQLREAYTEFRKNMPIDILGGTIYLYPIPLPSQQRPGNTSANPK